MPVLKKTYTEGMREESLFITIKDYQDVQQAA
jgi:hypothetical protein